MYIKDNDFKRIKKDIYRFFFNVFFLLENFLRLFIFYVTLKFIRSLPVDRLLYKTVFLNALIVFFIETNLISSKLTSKDKICCV